MTIGEYLKKLLSEKDIQLKRLAEMMGVRNRTELYRLFNDYHSEEKTIRLVDKMTACIDFTEEEINTIKSLISQKKISKFYSDTRHALSLVYTGIKDKAFEEYDDIDDIFRQCENKDTIMYISNIDDFNMLRHICRYLDENPNMQVYHYIRVMNRKLFTAYELAMLIILSRYKNYIPVIPDDVSFKGICLMTKKDDDYGLYSIEEVNGKRLKVKTSITRQLYEYYLSRQEQRNNISQRIKTPVKIVTDYIDLMTESSVFEQGVTFYSEGAPCFGNIPHDIISEMFKDIDYFGFPKDHPYVTGMLDLYKTRGELLMNTPGAKKMYLFDEEHIRIMMQTGISFDHAEMFKPMTPNQLRRYFNWLIEMARKRPDKIQFRFLKDGVIDKPYVYGENIMLYLFCSDTGYMDGFSIMMKNKGIFDIMNDFTRYIWEEFTISDEESIARLGHMMDEYIK